MVLINFNGTPELREAIRFAAFNTGKKNSSDFLRQLIEGNEDVKKEMKKLIKKVAK